MDEGFKSLHNNQSVRGGGCISMGGGQQEEEGGVGESQ